MASEDVIGDLNIESALIKMSIKCIDKNLLNGNDIQDYRYIDLDKQLNINYGSYYKMRNASIDYED